MPLRGNLCFIHLYPHFLRVFPIVGFHQVVGRWERREVCKLQVQKSKHGPLPARTPTEWGFHCFHLALSLKPLGGISWMSKTIQLQSRLQNEVVWSISKRGDTVTVRKRAVWVSGFFPRPDCLPLGYNMRFHFCQVMESQDQKRLWNLKIQPVHNVWIQHIIPDQCLCTAILSDGEHDSHYIPVTSNHLTSVYLLELY